MGYTHYYYVKKVLDKDKFAQVVKDFKKMVPIMEHANVILAGGMGRGKPVINNKEICFNGPEKCGHDYKDLGIAWADKNAKGVASKFQSKRTDAVVGDWFAGKTLSERTCGGDCSHETFRLEQAMTEIPEWKQEEAKADKHIFECTKTAFKPYDLAVNVCLIIAKHYLGKDIIVRSDGEMENWSDGMEMCQHFLGYGADFKLDEEREEEVA